ncbi:stage III sporulation protein AF [Virgibacillus oceani]|uniref:Stage III sporulation protein AF n=1 Tax=Virgibacillus oceani TaxID=1479511 RepID=A0A917H0F5_9BACI|nr:stage III sporulation protein AF [Virgibacillus oceani]GGG63926.1 stage III sporulation protein AF [Virgibacillus oceani]
MDALIQWATQIVVFLLLAMVIDLLIPANVMKKYIKLVVGLILILIFLKPIFFLFDINIQQALETSFQQLTQAEANPERIENSIEMQKNEIEDSQTAYILEEAVVLLKDQAQNPLLEGYQAEITDIKFLFKKGEKPTYDGKGLEEVIVHLRENENEKGEVNTVETVEINTDRPVTEEDKEHNTKGIKALLGDVWEIDKEKVTLIWEGEAP